MKKLLIVFWLVLLFPLTVLAEDREVEVIRTALTSAGIDRYLDDMNKTIRSGLNQRQSEQIPLPGLSYDDLTRLVDKHYTTERLLVRVAERMKAIYDPNRFDTLRGSLRSGPVVELLALKKRLASDEEFRKLQDYVEKQEKRKKNAKREELVENLDQATAESEWLAGMQALSSLALLSMSDALEPGGEDFPEDALLGQLYDQILSASQFTARMSYRYVLKDIPDEKIELYVRVYRSTIMQWFMRESINAVLDVMAQVRAEVRADINAMMKGQEEKKTGQGLNYSLRLPKS